MELLGRLSHKFVLLHVSGIPVRADVRWLAVLLVISGVIAGGIQPITGSLGLSFVLGLSATLVFFVSIFLHEFSHAAVARMEGLRVVEIRKGKRKETLKSFRVVPGMLRMGLHHQFNHPTRPASWQAVSVDDIAFDSNGVTALIHSLKLSSDEPGFSPDAAEIWKHGAIVYRREHSKLKSERIVPLSEPFARELLRYLKARDQYLAELGIESDALYPCPRKPFRYIADNDMRHLLVKGDKVAREKITEAGENPDRWVPEYRGTKWYGYRRLWKTELNRLGWERTSASMYAGDWKPLGRNIADDVYARITPGMLLAVVERIPFSEAVAREQERSGHANVRDLRPIDLSELIDR